MLFLRTGSDLHITETARDEIWEKYITIALNLLVFLVIGLIISDCCLEGLAKLTQSKPSPVTQQQLPEATTIVSFLIPSNNQVSLISLYHQYFTRSGHCKTGSLSPDGGLRLLPLGRGTEWPEALLSTFSSRFISRPRVLLIS
jgi:hypothetical protein